MAALFHHCSSTQHNILRHLIAVWTVLLRCVAAVVKACSHVEA